MHRETLRIETPGRSLLDITHRVSAVVTSSGLEAGLCQVFIQHTSASLLITENADPDVLGDLERIYADLAPDGDPRYRHTDEGPDDMSAHVRSSLTQTGLTVPVEDHRLTLGTWQGIFLWEHRIRPHDRSVIVTVW